MVNNFQKFVASHKMWAQQAQQQAQQQVYTPPTGQPVLPPGIDPGDRRMDQVEHQRMGAYASPGTGGTYTVTPDPGAAYRPASTATCPDDYVCFRDGTMVPQSEYQTGTSGRNAGEIVCPPGFVCYEDGSRMPVVQERGASIPPGRSVPPQPTPRQTNPAMGNAFAAFVADRMAGRNMNPIWNVPIPRQSMGPDTLVCDNDGNCHYEHWR